MGSVVSIMGACVAEMYKGPLIRHTSPQLRHTKQFFVFASIPEFWVLGGALLAAASFSVALWNFMQVPYVPSLPPIDKFVILICGDDRSKFVGFIYRGKLLNYTQNP